MRRHSDCSLCGGGDGIIVGEDDVFGEVGGKSVVVVDAAAAAVGDSTNFLAASSAVLPSSFILLAYHSYTRNLLYSCRYWEDNILTSCLVSLMDGLYLDLPARRPSCRCAISDTS